MIDLDRIRSVSGVHSVEEVDGVVRVEVLTTRWLDLAGLLLAFGQPVTVRRVDGLRVEFSAPAEPAIR